MSKITSKNKERCFDLIHKMFSGVNEESLQFDRRSGHYILQNSKYWTIGFEFPTQPAGEWYANVRFHNPATLSSKPYVAWHLRSDHPEDLISDLQEKLEDVAVSIFQLWNTDLEEDPQPENEPEKPVVSGSTKVIEALEQRPRLMWDVCHQMSLMKVASAWKPQEIEGEPLYIRYFMDPTSEDGLSVAASVSASGSWWLTRWLEKKNLSPAIKHPSKRAAQDFADSMLSDRGWKLL